MVRYRCDRSQLPGSAAYSRDNVPLSAPIHVRAGTESGPVLRRPNGTTSPRAAKIVRSQSGEAEFGGVLFHYVPDYPFGHTVAPVLARAADTSEYPASGEIGC